MSQPIGNKDSKGGIAKDSENDPIIAITTLNKGKKQKSFDSEADTDVNNILKKSPLLRKYSISTDLEANDDIVTVSKRESPMKKGAETSVESDADKNAIPKLKRKPPIIKNIESSVGLEAEKDVVTTPKKKIVIKKDADSSADLGTDMSAVSIPKRKPLVKKDAESSTDAETNNDAVTIPKKKLLIKKDAESSADTEANNDAVTIPKRKPLKKKDEESSAGPETDKDAVTIPKKKLLIKKDAESSADTEAGKDAVSIPRRKPLVKKEAEPSNSEISSEPVKIVRKKPLKAAEADSGDAETVKNSKDSEGISKLKKKTPEKEDKEGTNQDDPDAAQESSTNPENTETSRLRRSSIWDSISVMAQPVAKITSSLKNYNLKSKFKLSASEITKKKQKIIVIEQIPNTPPLLAGKSFKLFSPNNPLRNKCAMFFTQEFTISMINLLIFIQWFFVSIGTFEAQHRKNYFGEKWTDYIVAVINLIYIGEILGKMIMCGFIINPPPLNTSEFQMEYSGVDNGRHKYAFISHKAFLRDTLNLIDFVAVVSFWIDFILMFVMPHNKIYVFKMLSILRPMRLLVTLKYVSVIVESLKRSMPILINILLFLSYFFILFSVLGLLLFEGRLNYRCVISDTDEVAYPPKFCSSHYINEERTEIHKISGITHESLAWSFGYTCAYGFECMVIYLNLSIIYILTDIYSM
jgi:hypothetical protein